MGDRGNIFVADGWRKEDEEPTHGVYLYTHWNGYRIHKVLAAALSSPEGKSRLGDGPYLTRIIFDHLTEGASSVETGYGIAISPPDNEHTILRYDPDTKRVFTDDGRSWTVPEFIAEAEHVEEWA